MDARLYSPSVERNRGPIVDALRHVLPLQGVLLEVASGSGEHALAVARAFPALQVQPSEPESAARASVDAWCAGLPNVRPALALDAAGAWPDMQADAVLCINMVHISPWAATLGLLAGAARVLRPGGVLVLYGAFWRDGIPPGEGNIAFDADLRARDPAWGVRRLEDVAAAAAGFGQPEVAPMPADNLLVSFKRATGVGGAGPAWDGAATNSGA